MTSQLITGYWLGRAEVVSCECVNDWWWMANKVLGMAIFACSIGIDLGEGTPIMTRYCLSLCGWSCGWSLSRLFTCSSCESAAVGNVSKTLANTMG